MRIEESEEEYRHSAEDIYSALQSDREEGKRQHHNSMNLPPLIESSNTVRSSQSERPISDEYCRILVAEDQHINIEVMKSQLNRLGKIGMCDFCFNGEEALKLAQHLIEQSILPYKERIAFEGTNLVKLQPIKLMLLDFQMPKMNGI